MTLRHIVLNRAITICFKTKHRKDILDKVLDRAKTSSPPKHRNRLDALIFIKTSTLRDCVCTVIAVRITNANYL